MLEFGSAMPKALRQTVGDGLALAPNDAKLLEVYSINKKTGMSFTGREKALNVNACLFMFMISHFNI
jgi:hypothetical protein